MAGPASRILMVSRLSLMNRFLLIIGTLAVFAGCAEDDRAVPPTPAHEVGTLERSAERQRALRTALDTLEALVVTLEHVKDPISAWNRAAAVSRLLNELERTAPDFAAGADEDEAARRYPAEIDRLKRLEARRDLEMNRILEDPVTARVLLDEMNKAEQERAAGPTD